MLNKVIIAGRLGADPEMRQTQTGTPVATVNLAVDRDFKDKSGNRETDWIPVVAWDKKAEFLSNFFTKGRVAIVEGRLQVRSWTDKDGGKRTTTEVIAENIYFGDSKSEGKAIASATAKPVDASADYPDDDGDLPF